MHDVFSSLSLELVAGIVDYLNIEDIVQNQRGALSSLMLKVQADSTLYADNLKAQVSKQWCTILSCETIITPDLCETHTFLGLPKVLRHFDNIHDFGIC